jgi:hypothetical protein
MLERGRRRPPDESRGRARYRFSCRSTRGMGSINRIGRLITLSNNHLYMIRVSYDAGMEDVRGVDVNLWRSADHALDYLALADAIPHRTEGESVLLECLPKRVEVDCYWKWRELALLVGKRSKPTTRCVAAFGATFVELDRGAAATTTLALGRRRRQLPMRCAIVRVLSVAERRRCRGRASTGSTTARVWIPGCHPPL